MALRQASAAPGRHFRERLPGGVQVLPVDRWAPRYKELIKRVAEIFRWTPAVI